MNKDKRENERYLYGYAHVYDPYTFSEPKIGEMGYFTDNMEAFDNSKDPDLYYVYGELIDYNGDCKHPYRCDCDFEDAWGDVITRENNYAFYIPESSIPQEKQEWYKSHTANLWRYENE